MRWVMGVAVVLVLAGCTAPPPQAVESSPPTPTAIPDGTVLATGQFDPDDGVSGTVELLSAAGGSYVVRLTGFASSASPTASLLLSPYPLPAERTCLDAFALDLGSMPAGESDHPILPFDEYMGSGDPSFLDGAVIGMYVEADRLEHDCGRTILARAPFTWAVTDLHPQVAVTDTGEASGARGVVTLADGVPVSYAVASGDVLDAIADRFGVSVDDLVWLNPFRGPGFAIADEALNLDPDNRNAPWG